MNISVKTSVTQHMVHEEGLIVIEYIENTSARFTCVLFFIWVWVRVNGIDI